MDGEGSRVGSRRVAENCTFFFLPQSLDNPYTMLMKPDLLPNLP